jgi:hypothetical protein
MNPFQSLHDYEEWIYTLPQRVPLVKSSSLIIVRRGMILSLTLIIRHLLVLIHIINTFFQILNIIGFQPQT